jgi:hypothetical protein
MSRQSLVMSFYAKLVSKYLISLVTNSLGLLAINIFKDLKNFFAVLWFELGSP